MGQSLRAALGAGRGQKLCPSSRCFRGSLGFSGEPVLAAVLTPVEPVPDDL